MPKTTLEDLQGIQLAIKLPEVRAKIDAFALGTLHDYQTKFQKRRKKGIYAIKKQLEALEPSSSAYSEKMDELNALVTQPDLGFYYTIFLLDKLADKDVANMMIKAILSFDTLGIYLHNNHPVTLEEVLEVHEGAFIEQKVIIDLDEICRRRGIDTDHLKAVALKNRENTTYFNDDISSLSPISPLPPIVSPPKSAPKDSSRREWQGLCRQAADASANDALRKNIAQAPFSFDLLCQKPTQANIETFFLIAAELFDHAKMQDSAKLFSINAEPIAEEKCNARSTVALLQNSLHIWLILSLVKAANMEIFNQRLRFIMAIFVAANQKNPPLPDNATVDIYLPLFQLAAFLDRSVLHFHPEVTPSLPLIQQIASYHNPDIINEYVKDISQRKLAPMRMYMTRQLAINSENASMVAPSTDSSASLVIAQGEQIYDYFNPEHHLFSDVHIPMSKSAQAVLAEQSYVKSIFENVEYIDMLELVASVYVVHEAGKSIGRQLRLLENGLRRDPPQIFSSTDEDLIVFEGAAATEYITSHVKKIAKEVRSADSSYVAAVRKWCNSILEVSQPTAVFKDTQPHRPQTRDTMDEEASNPSSLSVSRRISLGLFRRRAISHPLPPANLVQPAVGAVMEEAVSCPSSLDTGQGSFFASFRRRSSSHASSSSPLTQSQPETLNGESGPGSPKTRIRSSIFDVFRKRSSSNHSLPTTSAIP